MHKDGDNEADWMKNKKEEGENIETLCKLTRDTGATAKERSPMARRRPRHIGRNMTVVALGRGQCRGSERTRSGR
jgi:hypothetical protein